MKTREEIQTEILAGGEAPVDLGGLTVRPVTFATLLMLRKLGNPLAAALESGVAPGAEDMGAIAEFLWVQCAPWAEVRRVVAGYRAGDRAAVDAVVLDFAMNLTPAQIQHVVKLIARHGDGLKAVAAEVIPDKDAPSDSKN